jgi:hypothetical protein
VIQIPRFAMVIVCACLLGGRMSALADDDDTMGGANVGERLFLETRFAEFFFTNSGGNPNAILMTGDPVMDTTATIYGPLPGSFAGQSMNCRACHLVEEHENTGNRTYCDFASRSPVPDIGDGRLTTPRNAMPLVDALLPRSTPLLLHNDGQFASVHDLVVGTLTGRNYGWQPAQYATAIHHIATIIRQDDGKGGLAQQYGGWSYTIAFEGLSMIESQYQIPPQNRMNVSITDTNDPNYVSDEQIVQNIADLMQQYMATLVFSQDAAGNFNGSPFDAFLIKNGLPQQPDPGETPLQYGHRLLQLVMNLTDPQWVSDPDDGEFFTNAGGQDFQFGTNELAGLEIFLTDTANLAAATNLQRAGITRGIEVGNCIQCHTPPAFTDFLFHNTGATQEEYDSIHGAGAFMNLLVPGLCTRATNYNAYLPPTANHPDATGIFETPPNADDPAAVDLGLWNVYANPDFPEPQGALQQIMPQLLAIASPQISAVSQNGTNIYFSGTNGPADGTYYVLATDDLTQPPAAWAVIATNFFDGLGNFSFTNVMADTGAEQQFYALQVANLAPATVLPQTLARFKTPGVRDLVSSEPYLHTGHMNTIANVLGFYLNFSAMARAGTVRNADPQLANINLDGSAVAPLTAFLQSLNESDYVDIPCPCNP